MNEGLKVVAAEEMVRIEKGLKGQDAFMREAGRKVAEAVIDLSQRKKIATLLVGRGNNGGDAYAAGIELLEQGFQVGAIVIKGECSPLNQQFKKQFLKKKGKLTSKLEGVVVDGFLGTGFKGKVEAEMAGWIEKVNASGLAVVAIDIPSGLNGTTGEVGGVAIRATETIALGMAKMGFFLRDGWNYVGKLRVVDFGLPKEAVAKAEAMAYLPIHLKLPKVVRNRHKYQAGYVVGFGGSKLLPGAVKLSGLGALKAGAGIVRIFHTEELGEVPLELICTPWSEKGWKAALVKAGSVFVGPGLGRTESVMKWLKTHLKQIKQPCVIDADALQPNLVFPKNAILTPHRGEVLRLLGLKTAPREEVLFAKIIQFCQRKKVIVVLKGAPTFVFAAAAKPVVIVRGDPGMATAGSGDVLTGMIAAILALGVEPREAAILGTTLHGIAGEEAAKVKTSYCLMATDLIDFMPAAFQFLLKDHGIV